MNLVKKKVHFPFKANSKILHIEVPKKSKTTYFPPVVLQLTLTFTPDLHSEQVWVILSPSVSQDDDSQRETVFLSSQWF